VNGPLLYLVRHAEVILRGDVPMPEWQLSPEGERAARDLAHAPEWRSLTLIASSPEAKAVATARPIAEAAGLETRIEPDLHEVERGATPLVTSTEYEALVAAHFATPDESVAGWERAADARARASACIEELVSAAEGSLCVVSHGLVLSHYLAQLRGLRAPALEEWRAIPLPGIAVVDVGTRQVARPFMSLMEFRGRA
jgi:broad specificity phosphatase PhoE